MHRISAKRDGLFMMIDCKNLTKDQFQLYFGNNDSVINKTVSATLYFHHIEHLPIESQSLVYSFICSIELNNKFRIIMSAERELEDSATKTRYLTQVENLISITKMYIQPLRNDHQLVETLVNQLIRHYNETYGRRLIGLTPDALDLLKSYEWPGNLRQLIEVILNLVLSNEDFYINKNRLSESIAGTGYQREKKQGKVSVDIHQPLEKIIFDVVRSVLEEEGGNRTRVAQRLDISRSTVWRILN